MVACMQLLKEKQLFPCVQPPRLAPPPARQTLVLPRAPLLCGWLLVPSVVLAPFRPPVAPPRSPVGLFRPSLLPLGSSAAGLTPHCFVLCFRPSAHPPPPCVRSACPSCLLLPIDAPSCLAAASPPFVHSFRLSDSRSPVRAPRSCVRAFACSSLRSFVRSLVRRLPLLPFWSFGRSVVAGCACLADNNDGKQ